MNRLETASLLLLIVPLVGCSDRLDVPRVPTLLTYDGSTGDIPLPNDLIFADNPSAANLDGTLNFPPTSNVTQQPLLAAMNSLDGWSTSAPISFSFSRGVDGDTLVAGESVRLFEADALVDPATGLKIGTPLSDILLELSAGVDYVVVDAPSDLDGSSWTVLPLKPLKPKTIYLVVVTTGVVDSDGFPVAAGTSYQLAKSGVGYPPGHPAAALQELVSAMESLLGQDPQVAPQIPGDEVVVAYSFTTQSTLDALDAVALVALGLEQTVLDDLCAAAPAAGHLACAAAPINSVPSALPGAFVGDTSAFGGTGLADVHTASLSLPYYLDAAPNPGGGAVESMAPLAGRWTARFSYLEGVVGFDPMETEKHISRYNTLPLETGVEVVPVLISLPGVASMRVQPPAGWPVVIFQHGIGQDRTDLLALADGLADAGFAALAIDLPLHGVVDAGNPLHVGFMEGGLRERTFGLDLVTQDSEGNVTASVADGVADSSGEHFINFTSLQTQRDNLRQSVADLFGVLRLIEVNLDVDGAGLASDFDPLQIHFLGHSLGGMVGTAFATVDALGLQPRLSSATLSAPGGGLPELFSASVTLGPTTLDELSDLGFDEGTPDFDAFMQLAQSVVDSGDPINFCSGLNGGSLPVLLHEIVGGGAGGGLADQVIPNSVSADPLSGTEPMIATLGLASVTTTTATSAAVVRFSEGTHRSLLDPDPEGDSDPENLKAYLEMQVQIPAWLASIPTTPTVTISDPDVIAP